MKQINVVLNPLRSPIAALLLALCLGPVGLIYASVVGAIILIFLLLLVYGSHSLYAMVLVWLIGCFWAVIATNRYNYRMMRKMGVTPHTDDSLKDL